MPIDTSSYYPEVPSQDGSADGYSLNRREKGLFGDSNTEPTPPPPPEPESEPRNQDGAQSPSPSSKSKDDDEGSAANALTWVSHILSWVLVPLFMPVYGLLLAFSLSLLDVVPMGLRINFTLIVAGITIVIPMLLVFLLKKIGIVNDIGLNQRKERLVPYVITIASYGVAAWFMWTRHAPMWLTLFFAGGAVAALVNMLINFKWKISAHAAGIAGVVALLIRIAKDGYPEPQIFSWLLIAIGLAGLLGSARVWLGRHTIWQVLAGYAVGFCSVFFLTMIR